MENLYKPLYYDDRSDHSIVLAIQESGVSQTTISPSPMLISEVHYFDEAAIKANNTMISHSIGECRMYQYIKDHRI